MSGRPKFEPWAKAYLKHFAGGGLDFALRFHDNLEHALIPGQRPARAIPCQWRRNRSPGCRACWGCDTDGEDDFQNVSSFVRSASDNYYEAHICSESDDQMKGSPVVPGGPLSGKPTGFSTLRC